MATVTVRMPDDLALGLQIRAATDKCSVSDVIRRMVREHVTKPTSPGPVERATAKECADLICVHPFADTLRADALKMARHVDRSFANRDAASLSAELREVIDAMTSYEEPTHDDHDDPLLAAFRDDEDD